MEKKKKAVVVTTEARGVFFGYVVDESAAPSRITLSGCRNCVYWAANARGFLGLAVSGPLEGSRVGPAAPEVTLYGLTSISACSPEATEAWEKASWS